MIDEVKCSLFTPGRKMIRSIAPSKWLEENEQAIMRRAITVTLCQQKERAYLDYHRRYNLIFEDQNNPHRLQEVEGLLTKVEHNEAEFYIVSDKLMEFEI